MFGLAEAIERKLRIQRRKRLLERIAEGDEPVDEVTTTAERIAYLGRTLETKGPPVQTKALKLYAWAIQEQHRVALEDLLTQPFVRVIDFSNEKAAETLWWLQGQKVAQSEMPDLGPVRRLLLKAHKVIINEPHLTYGDWTLIRQFSEEVLTFTRLNGPEIQYFGNLVSAIVEDLNGRPTTIAARMELQGLRKEPNENIISNWWRK